MKRSTVVVSSLLSWQVAASICFYTLFAGSGLLRNQFGVSRTFVGFAVSALLAGYSILLFPAGAAADAYGEKRILIGASFVLVTGLLVVVTAPTYLLVLVGAVIIGGGYAASAPGTNRGIIQHVPTERQGLAMGVKQIGVTGGAAISAVLVTGLAASLFWQSGFLVAAGLSVVVAGLFFTYYPESGGTDRLEWPALRALIRYDGYLRLVAAGLFLGAALFTTTGYVVLYVNESTGASIAFAGLVLAIVQVTGSATRAVLGWLADKMAVPLEIATGRILLGQAVGSVALFLVVPLVASTTAIIVVFALLGITAFGFTGIYYSCLTALVSEEDVGAASAGGQLAVNVGGFGFPPFSGTWPTASVTGSRGLEWPSVWPSLRYYSVRSRDCRCSVRPPPGAADNQAEAIE